MGLATGVSLLGASVVLQSNITPTLAASRAAVKEKAIRSEGSVGRYLQGG